MATLEALRKSLGRTLAVAAFAAVLGARSSGSPGGDGDDADRAAGRARDDRVTATSKGKSVVYVARSLHGFTVRVDARLLGLDASGAAATETREADGKTKELGAAALAVLDAQLLAIERTVRDGPLAKLRTIPLWLGLDDPVAPCACYHPSPEWLTQNGFDPKKAKSVEIAHAAAFVEWTHEQPWMVLHELAHGYDDQFLRGETNVRDVDGAGSAAARPAEKSGAAATGAEAPRDEAPARADLGRELDSLFEQATSSRRYESVLHWNGGKQRHYALENSKEYFAESTEAWLGQNDFYPFVRAELLDFDPAMAAFLAKVWGEPVTSARPR